MRWCAYWVHRRTMDNGMRITVFSAVCEALFISDRVQLHRSAWIFGSWNNCSPDCVPASPSSVSCFDGVINMKTPDFSLFSLPSENLCNFAVLPKCRSCPCLFSGVFRHWHALPRFQAHGVMALLPLPGVSHSDGHVFFKVLSSLDKYSLTKNRACSRISKRLENGCEKRKFPRL